MSRRTTVLAAILAALCCNSLMMAAAKPLRVYILSGQSNMEGQAKVETFDYIGDDPATAPMLKEMRGPDGKPRVCERVWISYLTGSPDKGSLGESVGKLTAGYGSRWGVPPEQQLGGKIGPEYLFGITIEKAYDGPILLIKTAWGGKSLNTDFRPPGAGPYEMPQKMKDRWAKHPNGAHGIPGEKDREEWWNEKNKKTGRYYRLMMEHVKKVLADPKRVCPAYDEKAGYELAGFVWFQGWNDMCDGTTYPDRHKEGGYALYSELMAQFIRDVRKDLSAPKMPFVIGVMGVGGIQEKPNYFRQAMAAPAAMPEFKGNVAAVETAPYWDKPLGEIESKRGKVKGMAYFLKKGGVPARAVSGNHPVAYQMRKEFWDTDPKDRKMSKQEQKAYVDAYLARIISPEEETMWKRGASNAGYHYLGCAKTLALIGKAFGEAMLEMEKKK